MSDSHGLDPNDRLRQPTVQFRIIVSGNLQSFESEVNDHLQHGWELHGCTHYTEYNLGQSYTQAVIKRPSLEERKPLNE